MSYFQDSCFRITKKSRHNLALASLENWYRASTPRSPPSLLLNIPIYNVRVSTLHIAEVQPAFASGQELQPGGFFCTQDIDEFIVSDLETLPVHNGLRRCKVMTLAPTFKSKVAPP